MPGYLTGDGQANYQFTVGAGNGGWYELWAAAANWPTNVDLDGTLVFHGQFESDVWSDQSGYAKIMNLYLTAGQHTLTFDRSWFPGLPYMTGCYLAPASVLYTDGDLAGSTHIAWPSDDAAFAAGQVVTVTVDTTNYGTAPEPLRVQVVVDSTMAVVSTTVLSVPVGGTLCAYPVTLPTSAEGVYDVISTDMVTGHAADRTQQYTVVDTATAPTAPPPNPNSLSGLYETQVITIDPNNTTQAPNVFVGQLDLRLQFLHRSVS